VIKTSKIRRRETVQLRPSRIRREPVAAPAEKKVNPYPTERETWIVVIGVILFAIAISIIMVGVSDATAN
jgi:hypothetical protein